MTKLVLAAMILLAGTTMAPAQNPEGWAYKLLVKDGKPVTGHDFGTVPKGAQLQYSFPITNIYAVPLTIETQPNCNCVTAVVSKHVLNPRETGTIDVTMDSRRFDGAKTVNLRVITVNQQQRFGSAADLTITAFCRMDVTLNPGVVNFGMVPRGQSAAKFVDIDYAGRFDWQIIAVPKNELFDVVVEQRHRSPGRVGYRVTLTLKADAPAGSFKQNLVLTTNDPSSPAVPVPFELAVQSPLAVFPDTVKFPSVKVGAEVAARVSVRGSGKPFKITEIEGLGDALTLAEPLPTEAKPVHILTLKLKPAQAGAFQRKLSFKTDGDKNSVATASVDASVNP